MISLGGNPLLAYHHNVDNPREYCRRLVWSAAGLDPTTRDVSAKAISAIHLQLCHLLLLLQITYIDPASGISAQLNATCRSRRTYLLPLQIMDNTACHETSSRESSFSVYMRSSLFDPV